MFEFLRLHYHSIALLSCTCFCCIACVASATLPCLCAEPRQLNSEQTSSLPALQAPLFLLLFSFLFDTYVMLHLYTTHKALLELTPLLPLVLFVIITCSKR